MPYKRCMAGIYPTYKKCSKKASWYYLVPRNEETYHCDACKNYFESQKDFSMEYIKIKEQK